MRGRNVVTPYVGGDTYTKILQLKRKKNKIETASFPNNEEVELGESSTPVPISRLFPTNEVDQSRNFSTSFSMISTKPLNISITPPVLPLCFANALLMLYAVHETGVDCKLPLLGQDVIESTISGSKNEKLVFFSASRMSGSGFVIVS